MKEYEITFNSCHDKRIAASIIEPDQVNCAPGLIHVAHGWGGNRFSSVKRDTQKELVNRYNLICVATEYRQSGYNCNDITGLGAERPYDTSHLQVIDCLNALRKTLELYPTIDKSRIIGLGVSQGGHITTLMPIFAPRTFALVISCSGISHIDAQRCEWAGRDFSEDELAIRNVVGLAKLIDCPVALIHGTADMTVPDAHSRLLEKALRDAKKVVRAKYIDGGGHGLGPDTSWETETRTLADDWLHASRNKQVNVFECQKRIVIPCVKRSCVIDWSKAMHDASLIGWEQLSGKKILKKKG